MTLFKGSGVAIVTPFDAKGAIDFKVMEQLLEFHLKSETDAIIVCGTTGESACLSDEEQAALIEFTVEKINHRIPVIAGTGSNDTQHMIELSLTAERLGVDGVLCVTPYYNKTSQEGLFQHFKALNDVLNTPIILYHVPSRTNQVFSADTVRRLSELEQVVGIKDASGDMAFTLDVKRLCGDGFAIYSGNDDMIIPLLSLGGVGVISVVANILPKETHDLVMDFLNKGETEPQEKYKSLIDTLFLEPNPIPVKKALSLMGYASQSLRLPLVEASTWVSAELEREMKEVNLI